MWENTDSDIQDIEEGGGDIEELKGKLAALEQKLETVEQEGINARAHQLQKMKEMTNLRNKLLKMLEENTAIMQNVG